MRLRLWLIGSAALLFFLCAVLLRHSPNAPPVARAQADSAPSEPAVPSGPLRRVWAVPVDGFRAAALSTSGDYVGVVSHFAPGMAREQLSLWRWRDRPLRPLWSRAEPNASAVAVSSDGASVLTCALLSPAWPFVSLRRGADGASVLRRALNGAVWDLDVAPDGQYAAFATGAGALTVLSLGDRPGFHSWPLGGIGNGVSFAPHSEMLAAGTWDASGVSCWTPDGRRVWQFPDSDDQRRALENRLFTVQVTGNGQEVFGLSSANVRQGDATLYLWRADGDGKPQWTYALGEDVFAVRALVTADGRFVAVTQTRLVPRGDRSVPLRQLLLLDTRLNTVVWKQGNLLFAPTLLALTPDGQRITVSDGVRTLYTLNRDGRITSTYTRLPGTIRQTVATPDGRSVLIYTSDGELNLLQTG